MGQEETAPGGDQAKTSGRRLAALDALRGAAMLLGVCLHASVSYMTGRLPGPLWGVQEFPGSKVFDALFWWIHGFRLPLFFLIAGIFTVVVYETRDFEGFLRHRSQRLLIPFLAGCALILPVCHYIWSFGWLITGRCTIREILRVTYARHIQAELYGPLHLWFLEDLFIISLIFAALRRFRPGSTPIVSGRLEYGLSQPLVLAIPSAALLFIVPGPVFAFHNSFIPSPARLAYFGFFFYVGVVLAPFRYKLASLTRNWALYLSLTIPSGISMLALLGSDSALVLGSFNRLALAAATAVFAWTSIFAWLGIFVRCFEKPRPIIRYLADASYWIYLVHLPIVALSQLGLFGFHISIESKFLLATGLALAIGLLTYFIFVRYSWIGAWLNGPRQRATPMPDNLSGHKIAA